MLKVKEGGLPEVRKRLGKLAENKERGREGFPESGRMVEARLVEYEFGALADSVWTYLHQRDFGNAMKVDKGGTNKSGVVPPDDREGYQFCILKLTRLQNRELEQKIAELREYAEQLHESKDSRHPMDDMKRCK